MLFCTPLRICQEACELFDIEKHASGSAASTLHYSLECKSCSFCIKDASEQRWRVRCPPIAAEMFCSSTYSCPISVHAER